MIGKLVKYEFQATARLYLPLYLVMVVFAFLGRLSLWKMPWQMTSQGDLYNGSFSIGIYGGGGFWGEVLAFLATMTLIIYVPVVLGSLVVHFVITLQRFWKNLLGDEGYLTFTLPVTTGQILWSKAICAFVWGILTALMVLISVLILAWHPWFLDVLRREWESGVTPEFRALIWQMAGNMIPPVLRPLLTVEFFINGFGQLFLLYAAMAIGHTVKRHKVLASLGAYAVITTVVGTAATLLIGAFLPVFAAGLDHQLELFMSTPDMLEFSRQVGSFLTGTWCVTLVLDLATSVGCFLLARYLLRTQLNLE